MANRSWTLCQHVTSLCCVQIALPFGFPHGTRWHTPGICWMCPTHASESPLLWAPSRDQQPSWALAGGGKAQSTVMKSIPMTDSPFQRRPYIAKHRSTLPYCAKTQNCMLIYYAGHASTKWHHAARLPTRCCCALYAFGLAYPRFGMV